MKRFLRFLFVMMGVVSGGLCFYLFSTPILQFTKSVGGSVVSTTDYTGYSLLTKENGMSIGALVAIILAGVCTLFMLVSLLGSFVKESKVYAMFACIALLAFIALSVIGFLQGNLYTNQYVDEFKYDTTIGTTSVDSCAATVLTNGKWIGGLGIIGAVGSLLSIPLFAKVKK